MPATMIPVSSESSPTDTAGSIAMTILLSSGDFGRRRRVAGADTNDYPPGVQRTGRPDRIRRFVARTCPYVRGNPAAYCRQRLRAMRQGTVIASGADGVPGLAQALLGAAFLGSGLLLHH